MVSSQTALAFNLKTSLKPNYYELITKPLAQKILHKKLIRLNRYNNYQNHNQGTSAKGPLLITGKGLGHS